MKNFVCAIALAALAVAPASVTAQSDGRSVAGAASGSFETGATLGAITVSRLELGTGVLIEADGSASGVFHAELHGALGGQARRLIVEGKITQGAVSADGAVTFSGTGTLDLDDGTPALPIGFLNLAAGANSVVLSIDAATLPIQLTKGNVAVE
jgi:hypothetical protein